jgi:hypothetical protein
MDGVSARTRPGSGAVGGVETEWKQQSEKPVDGTPQGLERVWQQSPQRTVPATAGQSTPIARSPRNSQA